MKWIPATRTLELSARNVQALLDKLDDPISARMLGAPGGEIMTHAVEDDSDAATESAITAARVEGVVRLTRSQLEALSTVGVTVTVAGVTARSVPDEEHYRDRNPGPVYMPSTGGGSVIGGSLGPRPGRAKR